MSNFEVCVFYSQGTSLFEVFLKKFILRPWLAWNSQIHLPLTVAHWFLFSPTLSDVLMQELGSVNSSLRTAFAVPHGFYMLWVCLHSILGIFFTLLISFMTPFISLFGLHEFAYALEILWLLVTALFQYIILEYTLCVLQYLDRMFCRMFCLLFFLTYGVI